MEELKWFATLGVGGVLAGVMFFFYRKDTSDHALQLTEQLDTWRSAATAMMQVVRENSVAITANTQTIEALHRRDDRIEEALSKLGFGFPHRNDARREGR